MYELDVEKTEKALKALQMENTDFVIPFLSVVLEFAEIAYNQGREGLSFHFGFPVKEVK